MGPNRNVSTSKRITEAANEALGIEPISGKIQQRTRWDDQRKKYAING